MRPFLFVLAVLAASAYAGTRFVVTTSGTLPQKATDGISLSNVEAVRATAYYTDGGTAAGGYLVPHYYDSATKLWIESKSPDWCLLESQTLIDGGTRGAQVCEWKVQAQYGRAAVVPRSVTPQATPNIRVEGWGRNLPVSDGGAQ